MTLDEDIRATLARACLKVSPDWEAPQAGVDPFVWARTSLDEVLSTNADAHSEATAFVVDAVRAAARKDEAECARCLAAAEVVIRQVEGKPTKAIKKPSLDEAADAWGDETMTIAELVATTDMNKVKEFMGTPEGKRALEAGVEKAFGPDPAKKKGGRPKKEPTLEGPRQVRRRGRPRVEPRFHIAFFLTESEREDLDRLVTKAGKESRADYLAGLVRSEISREYEAAQERSERATTRSASRQTS